MPGTGHNFFSRCESLVAPGGVRPGGAHSKPSAASGPPATLQVSVDAYSCWSFGRSACSLLDMTYETLRAGRTGEKKPEPIDGILRRRTVEPRDPRGAFITRRTRLLAADPPEKRIVVDNAPRKKCSQRWEPVE